MSTELWQLANPYHTYVFATSFWYFLRGIVRVIDPATVCGWFRPPSQWAEANDLELYTTRTDAWGLLALSALLLVLCDAVPLPPGRVGSAITDRSVSAKARRPYAVPAVLVTMAHHALTAVGAYTHYRVPSHYTFAMFIGVWGNVALILSGVTALVWLGGLAGSVTELREKEAARARRALGLDGGDGGGDDDDDERGVETPVAERKVGGHSLRKRT